MRKKKPKNIPREMEEEPKKKPIDRWLALGSLTVAITLYLIPKTRSVVIILLICIFILSIHPIWNFWWIEKSFKRRTWALILLVILLCILGFISWPEQANVKQPPSIEKVQPQITPPTFQEKIDNVLIELGERGMGAGYKFDKLKESKVTPFYLGGYAPITLYVENNRLYADFKLYGGKSEPPIEIVRNEFKVRIPGWDKNYNLEALEFVDKEYNPMFQLIYKTKSHIVIKGIFPFPGGIIFAGEKGARLINTSALEKDPNIPRSFVLKRIFKYPSSKYFGQLDDLFKPRK